MKVIITSKNIEANDYMKSTIEKKMAKLGKYFSDDIVANIMLSAEKNHEKIEATIKVRGMIFRAESKSDDIYGSIDKVIDKLSSQMSRFKSKIQNKHKDVKELHFDAWPDELDEADEELDVVRRKRFKLTPMNVDEAILQMEMLGHNFFVFFDMDTNSVNVVYKRANDQYGMLETTN